MNVIMNVVFPYIILGSLFGKSAGGRFDQTGLPLDAQPARGPAHAAIVSSAMFGTISGGPVVNVLSTGVLTIPMMIKRGFSRYLQAGWRPPHPRADQLCPCDGVAAFVLAAMTAVPSAR